MKLRKRRNFESIPLSAMGDIAFLLLIFYISTTMLSDQKPREIALPELTAEAQTTPYPIIIYLDMELAKENRVYFFNQEIPLVVLEQELKRKIQEAPDSYRVYLNIQKDLPFKYMYQILQKMKEIGIKNLIITTKPIE
ncbi:MAG: biopolymer transporter ExbD [Leptospiraceae bacterium]|nr:biopolymer transporter ExbD [Leptospiraceae bacterium]MDW7975432.1 biopolymer transporter ExbD [Leptospiraceae bacterium]